MEKKKIVMIVEEKEEIRKIEDNMNRKSMSRKKKKKFSYKTQIETGNKQVQRPKNKLKTFQMKKKINI